jgi:hypothetical protein
MDALIEFVDQHKNGKRVLMVAHNAPFDREMILKSIKNKALGYCAEYLKWEWLDTLHEVKIHFSYLKNKYWPPQRPHRMETLMMEFYPNVPLGEAHNAKADVENLSRILCEKLWGFLFKPAGPDDARDHEMTFHKYPPDYDPRTLPLIEVSEFGDVRTRLVYDKVMAFFNKIPLLRDYRKPCTALFLVGDVYNYALVKWQMEGSKGDCVYKGICDEVKLLLRSPPLSLVNDAAVLELCKYVSGIWSTNDFLFHTMTTQGDKNFYRSPIGLKIDWVDRYLTIENHATRTSSKVLMDDASAFNLKEKFDIGSLHELYMEYCFTPPGMRVQFCKTIQAYFPPEVLINPDTLQQIFKNCYFTE